jgi:hypothetical protein
MKNVITHQLAYRTDIQVTLCEAHIESYPYPLGSVQHGLHAGHCEQCELRHVVAEEGGDLSAAADRLAQPLSAVAELYAATSEVQS